jgi:hypothetical protein
MVRIRFRVRARVRDRFRLGVRVRVRVRVSSDIQNINNIISELKQHKFRPESL